MIVIGKTENGYILEASRGEVAHLIGYYSEYDKESRVNVGDEIQVNKMFNQLYELKDNAPELNKVVKTLRNLADLLEPVCPVIEKAVKEAVT